MSWAAPAATKNLHPRTKKETDSGSPGRGRLGRLGLLHGPSPGRSTLQVSGPLGPEVCHIDRPGWGGEGRGPSRGPDNGIFGNATRAKQSRQPEKHNPSQPLPAPTRWDQHRDRAPEVCCGRASQWVFVWYPPLRIDIIMKTYFSWTQKSSIWGVWAAPGGPRNHSKRQGVKRPAFWSGFGGPRGRPHPKNK